MEQVYERFLTPDGQPIGNGPRNYTSAAERLADALAKEPDALPERVEELRQAIERDTQSTCRGVDLTASVPKSVTVAYVAAWRAADEARADGQSERADGYEATRSALDGAIQRPTRRRSTRWPPSPRQEWEAWRRVRRPWVGTPNLVVASFPQLTSRAGDPQYHVHNVVLNRAQTDAGKIGALDTRDLGQQRHGYSAVFDRALAEELGAMGVEVAWKSGAGRTVTGRGRSGASTRRRWTRSPRGEPRSRRPWRRSWPRRRRSSGGTSTPWSGLESRRPSTS
jgi:hypothetical protein